MPDLVLDYHRLKVPIDHPLRSVTREHLEYPTEDVTFAMLAAIDKAVPMEVYEGKACFVRTVDPFTDKALYGAVGGCVRSDPFFVRIQDYQNSYYCVRDTGYSTSDVKIGKIEGGSVSWLASESVDLDPHYASLIKFSVSGSTLKLFRNDMSSPKLTATDTAFASGYLGLGMGHYADSGDNSYFATRILPPASPSIPAIAVLELDIIEDDGAYQPNLAKELVDAEAVPNVPEFLKRSAKIYRSLRLRGFTDEEIELMFGRVYQYQVDLAAVTWGVYEFRPNKASTVIVAIYGDNPYRDGAVEKQIAHARSRGRVFKVYKEYSNIVKLFNELRHSHPEWIAGKDNFAYQVLGHEELELFAVADFYFGELIEHRTHYDQLKRVPDWELWRTLRRLHDRLSKVNVLTEERDKHLNKVRKVMKLGW